MDKASLERQANLVVYEIFLPISTGFLDKIILSFGDLPQEIKVDEFFEIKKNNVNERIIIDTEAPIGRIFSATCSINYDRSNGELMEQETCESLKTTYPQIYQLFTNKERLAQLYDTAKIENIIQSNITFDRGGTVGNVGYTDGTYFGYIKLPSGQWIKNDSNEYIQR